MAGQREAKRSVCRPPINTENQNKVPRQNGVTEPTPLSLVAGTPSAPLRADRP